MISFPPWKFSRQGSNLCLSFYFASEFVTQFMKLLLNTDHEYDVSGRSSQCGKNDLAGQSSWWVAVFVNHSFCCVHRAVLSWKRWVFFFFPLSSSSGFLSFHLYESLIELSAVPLTLLRSDVFSSSLWSKQTSCLIPPILILQRVPLQRRRAPATSLVRVTFLVLLRVVAGGGLAPAQRSQKTHRLIWGEGPQYFQGGNGWR